jgi:predicted metal-dependent peptidase
MSAAPAPPVRHLDADVANRISAAKLWLVSTESPTTCGDMPYLASALYALVPVATERVTAMTIDEHWRLYVNPNWAEATDVSAIAARLAHLVWHLLADHADRARDLDVGTDTAPAWQRASDATVAETIESKTMTTGLIKPDGYGWDRGRSAEEYFALASGLPARLLTPRDDTDPGRGGEEGEEPDPGCGSGCDGLVRSYDLPPGDPAGSVDSTDADAIRRRVAIEFQQHVGPAGTMPGEWARWVQQILEPIVPWQQVLSAAVRRGLGWTHGHTDYTYTKISRRQAGAGRIVLPALRRPVPEVAIVVDTSGSVDDGLLAQALGEVDGILTSSAVPEGSVTVLAVDAAVQAVSRVRSARDVAIGGGGGTDMGVGIEAALALKPRPDVVIVLTDGYTPWPSIEPRAAVIAVLIGRSRGQLPPTPAWAHRVECAPA